MGAPEWILAALVTLGALPLLTGCYQFMLAGAHCLRRRRRAPPPAMPPRVAVIVPAWNEASVLGRTLDQLMRLEYPPELLRAYVVDDGSDDGTPELIDAKAAQYPGRVVNLRRENGGQGKAHTINHGLRQIQAEDWYEAVLVIDADVIFTPGSLRRMTCHFGDPEIGAVTAYIKEGSRPSNYMNRFIAFEYITAQAGARRAQNVLGVQACLAGGAQLITRESLEAVGGVVDTTTLAEDTVTTFRIQLAGKRVVFEPHAIVWAEEPREVVGLWKQRIRWARGNVQVTLLFRRVWLNRRSGRRLGGVSFALIWFSTTLMPLFMIGSSTGLIGLYAINPALARHAFVVLWGINALAYAFITASSFSVDPETARWTWREGLAFPGVVSLLIMLHSVVPQLFVVDGAALLRDVGIVPSATLGTALVLFTYLWLSLSMLAAYAVKLLAGSGRLERLVPPLVYIVGYGPLLCAITAAAYVAELRGAELRWDKTEKIGAVGGFG
jgi:cellulose synthase/poly-beta-1,6-N-acetylglucosamine synthase-like glycosyltransferase